MPDLTAPGLLNLAETRLADLVHRSEDGTDQPNTTLAAVMKRLFDPRGRDLVTVSAFGSAL